MGVTRSAPMAGRSVRASPKWREYSLSFTTHTSTLRYNRQLRDNNVWTAFINDVMYDIDGRPRNVKIHSINLLYPSQKQIIGLVTWISDEYDVDVIAEAIVRTFLTQETALSDIKLREVWANPIVLLE